MRFRRLLVYVDASVIGGCEDTEFGSIEIRTPKEVLDYE
jgi:hypothetical protein